MVKQVLHLVFALGSVVILSLISGCASSSQVTPVPTVNPQRLILFRDLFAVFYMNHLSQLFIQSVVQFLTTAHRRPPLVVKQPNYAVFDGQQQFSLSVR